MVLILNYHYVIFTGTMIGSKLGKEYNKAVYCHPTYLTYMLTYLTSCKMPGWMNHNL